MKRYGYAVLSGAAAAGARLLLDRFAGYHNPYTVFYVAVLWSAWYGGIGPALLTIALGVVASAALAPGTLVGFEFYLIVSLTCAILMEAQRRSEKVARERLVQLEEACQREKLAEEQVRQAQKMESIGILAGGIAHDFNNLLTGVLGNATLALADLPRDSDAARMLESVIAAAERAAHLTAQLLAYAGKGTFVEHDLDLSEMVRRSAEVIRPSVERKIELRLELNGQLPALRADPARMQQVIANLVRNAVEAIDGNPRGTVTVATERVRFEARETLPAACVGELAAGDYVALRVQDNGIGMDEGVLRKIFDPFFTTKFVGRGLGLAAVSGIVRSHRGAVLVSSEPGKGSVFCVLLPVASEERQSGAWRLTA